MSHKLSSLEFQRRLQELVARAQEVIDLLRTRHEIDREQYRSLVAVKRLGETRLREIDGEIKQIEVGEGRFEDAKRRADDLMRRQRRQSRVMNRAGFAVFWSVLTAILLYFVLALPNLILGLVISAIIGAVISGWFGFIKVTPGAATIVRILLLIFIVTAAILSILLWRNADGGSAGAKPPVERTSVSNGESAKQRVVGTLTAQIDFLRKYGARVIGAVPPICVDDEKLTEDAEVATGGPPAASPNPTPILVQTYEWLVDGSGRPGTSERGASPCSWLETPPLGAAGDLSQGLWDTIGAVLSFLLIHILAAISPDVGFIQKATLLMFFVGLAELRLIRVQRRLAEIVAADEVFPSVLCERMPEGLRPGDDKHREIASRHFSLFPRRDYLVLAHKTDEEKDDTYNALRGAMVSCRDELQEHGEPSSMTGRLVDYVAYIMTIGRMVDRTETIVERAQIREANYEERLSDGFWKVDYIVWLLPTIGFLGTIYGISASLSQAKFLFRDAGNVDEASGDRTTAFGSVIDALGIAFDTTAIALFLVAILLILQWQAEAQVRDFGELSSRRVREKLLDRLMSRDRERLTDQKVTARLRDVIDELTPPDEKPAPEGPQMQAAE